MNHNAKYGKIGENIASKYLLSKGYTIVFLNYRINNDEIDVIAKHNNTLIFIEVKTRLSSDFGYAEEQLIRKKRNRLHRAIGRFMAAYGLPDTQIRVEFIAINLDIYNKMANIKHFFNIL
jgi:putative endonuclease